MKHIIWDLDGTLVDSYPIIIENLYNALSEYEDNLDKTALEHYIKKYSIADYFSQISKKGHVDMELMINDYKEMTQKVPATDYKLIEETRYVIERLNKNHRNYIYTHRDDFTNDILKANDLELFVEVVTKNYGLKRKPEPDGITFLVDKYDLNIEDTYYVGDRQLDIDSGNNAGVNTVYFDPIKEVKDADYNIKMLSELIKIIEEQ